MVPPSVRGRAVGWVACDDPRTLMAIFELVHYPVTDPKGFSSIAVDLSHTC
jgi:hypothetical protein